MKNPIQSLLLLGLFLIINESSLSEAASKASHNAVPPSLSLHKKKTLSPPDSSLHLHQRRQYDYNHNELFTSTSLRGGDENNAVESPKPAAASSSKMSNFLQRAPPAILMILLTYILISKTGSNGIICLVLLLQTAMYSETTSIIEDYHYKINNEPQPFKIEEVVEKWWWFLTVLSGTSLRNILESMWDVKGEVLDLVTYGMASVGLLCAVVGMATHVSAGPDVFRSYLGKVAASHFALLFLVGQSSFWIKTVQEYGILWVLYPAILVIINDTMAYVFGVLMGKHKLLPRLSPKKTVEGFVGAGLSTLLASLPLLKLMSNWGSDTVGGGGEALSNLKQHAYIMAAYTSLIAPFGGFLASAVKRAHGAKDFGSLIPGHGGVVDRFDCQVVTAPFVYLYLKQFL